MMDIENAPATIGAVIKLVMKLEIELKSEIEILKKRIKSLEEQKQ